MSASAGLAPIRFAVLGAADVAWRRMVPAMLDVAQVRPVAVASRTPGAAERFAGRFGTLALAGYEQALNWAAVDAVYIALPNALHAHWAEQALTAGKHVLVEKPLTTDHRSTLRLHELAASRQLVLMEAMASVHHSQHEVVRRLAEAGQVGAVQQFSAAFSIPPRPQSDIRYQAALGGGALLDTGVYPVRAAQYLLGPELELVSASLRYDPARGVDLAGQALLISSRGVRAELEFGLDQAYRASYELAGSAGRLRLDRAFTPPSDYQPVVQWHGPDGRADELVLATEDQFANLLRHFAAQVHTGVDADQVAASLAQAQLIDRIRELGGAQLPG